MFQPRICLLALVLVVSLTPLHCFVIIDKQTTHKYNLHVLRMGFASDMARRLGKMVGESDWKQVSDAFQEGFDESQINAKARNAKPMEALPAELVDSTTIETYNVSSTQNAETNNITTRDVVDAEIELQDEEER